MPIQSISNQDATKITSGQVIVDLTAIVKELIDNAIDAGSDKIDVTLHNYGAISVEVSDNGHGIDPGDFPSLCLKHHTSKLQTFQDLACMTSLGFRGEAMSSLCAMAHVSIVTCSQETFPRASSLEYDSMGTLIQQKSSVTGKKGTSVLVKDMFHAMPVRQKNYTHHIKREYSKALAVMMAYLVTYPHIRFTLYNISGSTGKKSMVFGTQGLRASIPDVLVSLYGSSGARGLVPIDFHIENIHARFKINLHSAPSNLSMSVNGFISDCSFGMGRGATDRQFISINSRPVTYKRLAKLVNEVYRSFNTTQSPVFVLNFTLDPSLVDVNVTPDKQSVMMQYEDVLCEVFREELTGLFNDRNNYVPKSCVGVVEMGSQVKQDDRFQRSSSSIGAHKLKAHDEKEWEDRDEDGLGNDYDACEEENADDNVAGNSEQDAEHDTEQDAEQDSEQNAQQDAFEGSEAMEENTTQETKKKLTERSSMSRKEVPNTLLADSSGALNVSFISPPSQSIIEEPIRQTSGDIDNLNHATSKLSECPAAKIIEPELNTTDDFEDLSEADLPPDSPISLTIGDSGESVKRDLFVPEDTDDSMIAAKDSNDMKAAMYGDDEAIGSRKEKTDCPGGASRDSTKLSSKRQKLHHLRQHILLDIPGIIEQDKSLTHSDSKHLAHLHDLTEAMEIKKQDFLDMKVIGQFNLGFIIVKHDERIFIVDQHASDEIYNFEMLMSSLVLQAQPLVVPRMLELSAIDEMVVLQHSEQLYKNGFIIEEVEDAVPGRRVQLRAVPVSKNIVFDDSDMHELVHKLHEHGGAFENKTNHTGNVATVRCTKVDKMIASRACRSSIMIGQALSRTKMSEVVQHLAGLDKPWNCPHGRPTVRHLADFQGEGFCMDYEL